MVVSITEVSGSNLEHRSFSATERKILCHLTRSPTISWIWKWDSPTMPREWAGTWGSLGFCQSSLEVNRTSGLKSPVGIAGGSRMASFRKKWGGEGCQVLGICGASAPYVVSEVPLLFEEVVRHDIWQMSSGANVSSTDPREESVTGYQTMAMYSSKDANVPLSSYTTSNQGNHA